MLALSICDCTRQPARLQKLFFIALVMVLIALQLDFRLRKQLCGTVRVVKLYMYIVLKYQNQQCLLVHPVSCVLLCMAVLLHICCLLGKCCLYLTTAAHDLLMQT